MRQVPPEPYVATGIVNLSVAASNAQTAVATVAVLLKDYEQLLTLAHPNHVFFGTLRCYEDFSLIPTIIKPPSSREGQSGIGCFLWAKRIPQFLEKAVPRLDNVAGFRYALEWYNEVTAFTSKHVAEIEFVSLWTAFEVLVNSRASELQKDHLLNPDQIKEIRRQLSPILRSLGLVDPARRASVYKQLKALERPAGSEMTDDLLTAYRFLQYRGDVAAFRKIRNTLVHGGRLDYTRVNAGEAILRLRRLMQKLLFAMAGIYDDPTYFRQPIDAPDLSAR
jgi:hypothetical protein